MLTDDRRALILRELHRKGSFSVADFAAHLGVSGMTVRRDLAALEAENLLQRVHGGAIPVQVAAPAGRQHAGAGTGLRRMPGAAPHAPQGARGGRMAVPTIGLVMPNARYYFATVVRGAEAAARDMGARLVLAVSNYSQLEEERQIERLLANKVDGLIVTFSAESLANSRTLELLASADIPIVVAERPIDDVRDDLLLESVRSDHVRGAEVAVNHLIGLGHTRIALCTRRNSPTTAGVRSGYRRALERAGLPWNPGDEHSFGSKQEEPESLRAELEEALEKIMAGELTAVLLLNDQDALTFVDSCQSRGISIPEDLAIVAYDDEVASMGAVPLTAIAPPKFDVGYQALQMCLDRLDSPAGKPTALRQVSLSPALVVRESSGHP
ncbi:substrate-binding domain-containing protein [Arthrobacter sp. HY1533]|uniref:substrate-binding domain-containing protein n=1 Tax=Arthrobacter sp. HY1533 TaxID=2970919 RepID=UPI0022B9D63B|nr:substrate-binding domain-containing protein [Arthrobacter sp. HY1533]